MDQMLADLHVMEGIRSELDFPIRDFLTNQQTGYFIDEEQTGQALLLLLLRRSVRDLEESSRRLEKTTRPLLGLTVVLAGLTVALLVMSVLLLVE